MSNILHINSSVRNQGSISRKVTAEFLSQWQAAHPGDTVVERDLTAKPVPHLSEEMLGAFFTPAEQRSSEQAATVKLSDDLVAELFAADVILIGAPMYNFSISSTLKAWIDHVARAGMTFKYTEAGPVGLLQGKRVYIFTSRGGIYSEGSGQSMDFHGTYLRSVLSFIGLNDITFVHTEGLAMGEKASSKALTRTHATIGELVSA